jgi:hypothetical protein
MSRRRISLTDRDLAVAELVVERVADLLRARGIIAAQKDGARWAEEEKKSAASSGLSSAADTIELSWSKRQARELLESSARKKKPKQ